MQDAIARIRRIVPIGLSYVASGGSLAIASASQLVTFGILARFLGVHEFSLFVFVTAFTAIAIQLCGLGASDSLVRRVSRDVAMYPAMLGHNYILTFSTGALLVLVGTFTLPFFYPLSDVPLISFGATALLIIANVPMLRMIMLSEQIFIAHSQFGMANRVVIVSAVTRSATAAVACMVLGVKDVATWSLWHIAANGAVAILCLYWQRPLGKPVWRIVTEEVRLGIYFSTQFIFRALKQNADVIALSLVAGHEMMSSYAVARRILDSSYIAVDALYRVVYPKTAMITAKGIHHAMNRVRTLLLVTVSISIPTSVAIFLLAPLLPILFGDQYVSLTWLVQTMCWAGIIVAVSAAALETLSASGHQGERALIINGASTVGAFLVFAATWFAQVNGAIAIGYVIEIGTAVAAWFVMLQLMKQSSGSANTPTIEATA